MADFSAKIGRRNSGVLAVTMVNGTPKRVLLGEWVARCMPPVAGMTPQHDRPKYVRVPARLLIA
jgi:hypothetical protein